MAAEVDQILAALTIEKTGSTVADQLSLCGFPRDPRLVADVLERASVLAVRRGGRGASWAGDPSDAAEVLLRQVIDDMSRSDHARRGRNDRPPSSMPDGPVESSMVDAMRRWIGQTVAPPWLTAAALAYLTLLQDPSTVPVDVVAPTEGLDVTRVRAWHALWAAGSHELFAEPVTPAVARRLDHKIDDLIRLIDDQMVRWRLHGEPTDG